MLQPSVHLPHSGCVARLHRPGLVVALLMAMTLSVGSLSAAAAPDTVTVSRSAFQNVEYLDAEAAQELNLDFPVLVPSYVPAPFSGAPSVSGGGGSYSLYWMVPGVPPTFLNITGEVGGSLPDGSRDDFNNELFINDTIRGVDAIHEVTSTYDDVWWIADGVLYSVKSLNVQGIDSRGLANELIVFEPPAQATEPAEEETPESEPAPDPTREAPAPVDNPLPGFPPVSTTEDEPTSEADPTAEGEAVPPLSENEAETPPPTQGTATADLDASDSQVTDGTPLPTEALPSPGIVIPGTPAAGGDLSQATPNASPEAELSDGTGSSVAESDGASPGAVASDGTGSSVAVSDGTGGAAPPIQGSDGTGGTRDLSLTPDRP